MRAAKSSSELLPSRRILTKSPIRHGNCCRSWCDGAGAARAGSEPAMGDDLIKLEGNGLRRRRRENGRKERDRKRTEGEEGGEGWVKKEGRKERREKGG